MSSFLSAIYKKRPINLWVEDEPTRAYLGHVWQDNDIELLLAGGAEQVQSLVHDSGQRNVFGYRSRGFDFDRSNAQVWRDDDSTQVWISGAFEAANFILDEDAIAGSIFNTAESSARAIAEDMLRLAAPQSWWMACRSVVASLSKRANLGFIRRPDRARVADKTSALAWIITSSWTADVAPSVPGLVSPEAIEERITSEERRFSAMTSTSQWKSEFSGKEILLDLVSMVWTTIPPRMRRTAILNDFAKAVAHKQRRLGTIPQEIHDLRSALRLRVGLAPANITKSYLSAFPSSPPE
jgi:hypothetical protein